MKPAILFQRRHSINIFTFGLLAFLLCRDPLAAQSVTLTADADTTLIEVFPNNNMGGEITMMSGTRRQGGRTRGLVRFDLSSIPPDAVVTAAALTLVVTRTPTGARNSVFDVRRVLVPWGEGARTGTSGGRQGVGSTAAANEASWINRLQSAAAWTTRGGQIGADFFTNVSATATIAGNGSYTFGSTPSLVTDVQGWVNNSVTNNGWVFLSESESSVTTIRRFGSREGGFAAPSLQIDYVRLLRINSAERDGDLFRLRFDAEANQTYTVECRDFVAAGGWTTLTNIGPLDVTAEVVATDSLFASTQRFFRVVKQ